MKKIKRLTIILLVFGCVVSGSTPTVRTYAKESALVKIEGQTEEEEQNEEKTDVLVDGETAENKILTEADIQETDIRNVNVRGEEESAQADGIIEKNANEINYIFVESPYLESPGTERIVVSYGDGSENVEDMSLTVMNVDGKESIWELSANVEQLYLFTNEFADASETGVYEAVSLNVMCAESEKSIRLSDLGMETLFGVNEEYKGIEALTPLDVETTKSRDTDEMTVAVEATVAEIDPYNIEKSEDQIAEALENARIKETSVPAVSGSTPFVEEKSRTSTVRSDGSDIVVALDPGHDATHVGASSDGLKEEVLTLKIAKYCKEELEKYDGLKVYMTRTGSSCPHPGGSTGADIKGRVEDAKKAGADIYVSLHLNSSVSSSASGSEIIIQNDSWKPELAQDGKKLAEAILKELMSIGLDMRDKEIYSKNTSVGELYSDGSISDYYAVHIYSKEAGIPGIIVEHAFISNRDDQSYLNNDSGLKKLGIADATGIAKYLGLDKGKWVTDNQGNKFFYVNNEKVTGVMKIEGVWYYFDPKKDGVMHVGWRQDGTKRYYYDSDGKLALGVTKIGSNWYYFQSNGVMYTGWRQDGTKRYYYDSDGKLALGVTKIGSNWYYFRSDGAMYTGWRQDRELKYYYDAEGKLVLGVKKVDSNWYYFQSNGAMYTGWRQDGELKYYYDAEGKLARGKKQIEGSWYYFKNNGNVGTGWCKNGKETYYCDSNGKLMIGTKKIDGYWYFFDINGNMYIGWREDGSDIYYYDAEGKLALGEVVIGTDTYYFQSNGKLLKNDFANRKYYGPDGKMVPASDYGSVFYRIEGKTTTTIEQMIRFYEKSGNVFPSEELGKGGAETIEEFAEIFYEEANAEGIKAEVLWAQTMFETGYLKFGGQVKIEQFNFAGIGAMDDGTAGASFADVRTGVRAQVQHMKAYASTEALKNVCIDPRFDLVTRGSAQYVETLGQKENPTGAGWATTPNYGVNLAKLIGKINNV